VKELSGVAGSGGWLSVGRFRIGRFRIGRFRIGRFRIGCAGKPGPSLEIDPIPFMIC
jgi:hypothetical protein